MEAVNPNFPCKVIIFSIQKSIDEGKDPYTGTCQAWYIRNKKYLDTTKYEFAVGLNNQKVSLGAFKINTWKDVRDSNNKIRYKFEGEEKAELKNLSWHKQIAVNKNYFRFGAFFVVEFDGQGKFRLIRPGTDQRWFDC